MFKQKRVMNEFTYTPMNEREGQFGLPMPKRKGGERKALFWLSSGEMIDELKTSIYFINSSDEILKEVIYSSAGMQTIDDDVVSSASNEYSYQDVLPGEAVKIDEYDAFYGSDDLVQYQVRILSDKYGNNHYLTLPDKGLMNETVLVWDDREIDKYVTCNKL